MNTNKAAQKKGRGPHRQQQFVEFINTAREALADELIDQPRLHTFPTAVGRDFLPVLFMIGAWGRKYRGKGKLTRFFDAMAGTEIQPLAIDEVTGARIGTRPIRTVVPDKNL